MNDGLDVPKYLIRCGDLDKFSAYFHKEKGFLFSASFFKDKEDKLHEGLYVISTTAAPEEIMDYARENDPELSIMNTVVMRPLDHNKFEKHGGSFFEQLRELGGEILSIGEEYTFAVPQDNVSEVERMLSIEGQVQS